MENNKTLHENKELLVALLTSPDFSKKNVSEISRRLQGLINSLPKINDKELRNLVGDYMGIVLELVSTLPEEEIQRAKPDVIQAFNEVWKLIVLCGCSEDLKPHYDGNPGIIPKHFGSDISQQKEEVKKHLSNLDSLIPAMQEPEDENYKKLKQVLGKGRLLTPEERKQKEKETEKMTSEELFREYGLD